MRKDINYRIHFLNFGVPNYTQSDSSCVTMCPFYLKRNFSSEFEWVSLSKPLLERSLLETKPELWNRRTWPQNLERKSVKVYGKTRRISIVNSNRLHNCFVKRTTSLYVHLKHFQLKGLLTIWSVLTL